MVKKAVYSDLTDEAAVEIIMSLIADKHHCQSCDMHACGDLDRGFVNTPLSGMSFEQSKEAGKPQS